MAKIKVLVSDPPWDFGDSLTMSSVKRGAKSNYNTLSIEELKNLPVKDIVDTNAVIALWCPSSLIKEGIEVLEAWGFRFTQTHIWVKTKKHPFDKSEYVAACTGLNGLKEVISKQELNSSYELSFENHLFKVPVGARTYLSNLYGDYMQLPPEEQRKTHFNGEIYKVDKS